MDSRKVNVLIFLTVLLVLTVSETVQAQKVDINASEIVSLINYEYGLNREYSDNIISGTFNLTDQYIDKNIVITNSEFRDYVDLTNIKFRSPINFQGSTFRGKTSFKGVRFDENANFRKVNFSNDVDFRGANFNGQWANFNGANFTGNVVFIDVNFNSADFTGATFSGNADFTGAKFNKVYFYNAKFNKVILNESDYTTMIGSFSPFQDTLVFNDATYIKLMKNFKDNGQFDDADVVVYKYRQIKQESKKGVSWLWDEIQRLIYGYGTKPENSLLAGLITIFLFSYSFERNSDQIRIQWDVFFKKSIRIIYKIVPSWFFDKFILLANKIPPNRIYEKFKLTLKKCLYYLTPTWDGFYYSWITFITVGYIDTKINRQRLATMVEGLLGWLILSLFIVSLANQIIRQ